ncbi:class I SAM-dependent methyltransferase [Salinigranum salinum]|uniref:class I SAM-dependent methyltransferase n=1 Tax=Salinigranum salinum TaxID=1364937 RepID=UPI0012604942|nr:class I SAM-dependent methyltransferase [Salinigranum salinum]
MTDGDPTPDDKRTTAARFDAAAPDYLESDAHRTGADLETLAAWCADADRALDMATGAGHTAGALADVGVRTVVATDAAPTMVATAVETYGVEGCVADAERLPFAAETFDAVSCRIAAHHFPAPEQFVAETARVLVPGGVFAFEDNVAPDDARLAAFLDRVERRRDPTHVGLDTPDAWRRRFEAAGFAVETVASVTRRLDFAAWCDRTDVSGERRRKLRRRFEHAPPGAVQRFEVAFGPDGVESFVVPKRLFRLRLQTDGTSGPAVDERQT